MSHSLGSGEGCVASETPRMGANLGGGPEPAQVLGVGVVADVVGLTLRPGRAQRQAVAVSLHLLHLGHTQS